MAQIFPRSANSIARMSIIGGIVAVAAIAATGFLIVRSPYATGQNQTLNQPVPFSHKHHSGGDGIDCRYCHTSVEYSYSAGMPSTRTCMNCHSQLWLNSPNLEPVRESWRTGEPIAWNRVHDLPDFVYFNHSIHVNKGFGCSSCHGAVTEMQLMWQAVPLTMEWCLECHSNPAEYIRPKSEIYNAQYVYPSNQDELGHRLVREYNVHSKMACSTCHR